jgi:hypothetical protein
VGDYIPGAPINDDVKKRNQNLPGGGGIFNLVNLHTFHYAGNNPLKYTDPDGRDSGYAIDNEGAGGMGHAGIYMRLDYGNYAFLEITGISNDANGIPSDSSPGDIVIDKYGKETVVLSNTPNSLPTPAQSEYLGQPGNAGALLRRFDSKADMEQYLKNAGFDEVIEFGTDPQQDRLIYNAALFNGRNFTNYNVLAVNCGQYARDSLTSNGSGLKPFHWSRGLSSSGILNYIAQNAIPKAIGADLMTANKSIKRKL